jgi:hypothetical protein
MIDDKIMLGVPVSETFDENMKYNLYEDDKKGVYGYLGLYKDKAIRAVGKVLKVVEITKVGNEYKFSEPVTPEERYNFLKFREVFHGASSSAADYRTKVFFVDKFYATNYINVGKTGIVGAKKFLLDEILKVASTTEEIACHLDGQIWELEKGKEIKPQPQSDF